MATTKGSAIASPQIYGSDPVEQTFAKGVTDLDTGGISYAMLNAARSHRASAQQSYMDALRESNMMASKLAMHEADQDLLKEMLKSQAELANAGVDVSTFNPALTGKLYSNVNDPRVTQPSFLSRDLKAANALKARADAAHAASGGSGGGVQFELKTDYGPGNTTGNRVETFKGKDPAAVAAAAEARAKANAAPGTGTVLRGDGTVGVPTTPDARSAVVLPPGVPGSPTGAGSQARTQGQAQREAEARARAEAQRTQQQLQRVQ